MMTNASYPVGGWLRTRS